MSDEDIIALIRQYLADSAANGNVSIGGNWPYDDYGVQSMIGGVGAVDANAYPFEDWAQFDGSGTAQPYGSNAIGSDGMYLGEPYAPTYTPLPSAYSPEMAALQYGLEQRQQPKEVRPFWEPFRGYSGAAQLLQPMSAPLMRRETPMLGVGPVQVQQTQESRKETSKRRPIEPERTYSAPPQRIVDQAMVYQPSPVVRTLVAAPTNAVARNLFR